MDAGLGKIRKFTGMECPDCGKRTLTIREHNGKDKLVCEFCGFEEKIDAKRIRRKEDFEEPIPDIRRNYRPTIRRA
jgi:Zn ribbon nucleic-acid-binding protein